MKRLILCADDFALSRDVSDTIVALAHARKINAISCMAARPGWAEDGRLLRALPSTIEIGLHIVLTDEAPLTAAPRLAATGRLPGINSLTWAALRRHVALDEVRAEVAIQFDRFYDVLRRPPAFVDGHQHAHVLPGIRDVVLSETVRCAPGAWLRNCSDRPAAIAQRPFAGKALASAMWSAGLTRHAQRMGLPCNDSFGGHYDFGGGYAALFPHFLRQPGQTHLVMCHPGAGHADGDSIAAARADEAAALFTLPIAALAAQNCLAFPSLPVREEVADDEAVS